MKKRLNYLFIIFIMFLFVGVVNVSAYTCKYTSIEGDDVSFKVKDGKIKNLKTSLGGNKGVKNWSEEYAGVLVSSSLYAKASFCLPYLVALDTQGNGEQWKFYLYETGEQYNSIYEKFKGEKKENEIDRRAFALYEGPKPKYSFNKNIRIIYESNNEAKHQIWKYQYGGLLYKDILVGENSGLRENMFDDITGYTFTGWNVYFYDSSENKQTLYTIKDGVIDKAETGLLQPGYSIKKIVEKFNYEDGDEFIVKAQWSRNEELTSSLINKYNLGKGACETQGYVWNENEYNNYCNVDSLLYVACGEAFDIPHEVPELFSFAVNFLKILTPIILIFISIISLVKALASSNEDEIKKAQKGLIKKAISAAMVFFIVSIVQFVIMKAADNSEKENISNCLTCFLNNDCGDTLYYKTNVAGTYMCTNLVTGKSDICQEENNKPSETPQVKPENTTKPEEKPNNSGSDRVHGGGRV